MFTTFYRAQNTSEHGRFCKNEVEPRNLNDDLRNTAGYSKEVRKATLDKI